VVPFYADGRPECLAYLDRATESVLVQTDPRLVMFIVDDASPDPDAAAHLASTARRDSRVKILHSDRNRGPAHCRNLGIRAAVESGAPFVSYLDADDRAHPNRVEVVREILAGSPDIDIVYSSFVVVDEYGTVVPRERLIQGLRIILDDLVHRPLNGRDVWITLAVDRDTLTIPSALNVRTELAVAVPFPASARFHEDTHTWLRYSASGANVHFTNDIPSHYTVPMRAEGSRSRERAGGIDAFNRLRADVITEGLREAIQKGISRGVVSAEEGRDIVACYLLNVAGMIAVEGSAEVAAELVARARREVSPQRFHLHFERYAELYPDLI
jgi:glycosyltransferase involved in cell wall biosynthesis